jgi:hypothetical protein
MYTDPSGEFWHLVIGAVVGGVFNWAANGCQFNSQGLAYFGTGAAAGFVTALTGNPYAGAAILGAGNSITSQVATNGWNNIDIGQVMQSVGMSVAMAGVGQALNGVISPYIDKFASSLFSSTILNSALSGAISNGISGFALGSLSTAAQGGSGDDVLSAGLTGLKFGVAMGLTNGVISGIKQRTVFKQEQALKAQAQATTIDNSKGFVKAPIEFQTSSTSQAVSRTYTIYNADGTVYKFGVTDANLIRYNQSLSEAGLGATGKFSAEIPKFQAHISEKYIRSLHFNSTGIYRLDGMKIPYPRNFDTGLPIKPIK